MAGETDDEMPREELHEMFVRRDASGRLVIFAKHPNQPVVYDITDELKQQFAEPH